MSTELSIKGIETVLKITNIGIDGREAYRKKQEIKANGSNATRWDKVGLWARYTTIALDVISLATNYTSDEIISDYKDAEITDGNHPDPEKQQEALKALEQARLAKEATFAFRTLAVGSASLASYAEDESLDRILRKDIFQRLVIAYNEPAATLNSPEVTPASAYANLIPLAINIAEWVRSNRDPKSFIPNLPSYIPAQVQDDWYLKKFECYISHEPIRFPVILMEGKTPYLFEHVELHKWISQCEREFKPFTNPATNNPINLRTTPCPIFADLKTQEKIEQRLVELKLLKRI